MPLGLSRENIIPVGNYSTSQLEGMIIPRAEQLKHYVGTIEIPEVARGTVCLLDNGRMLTCLHNVMDYPALKSGKAELIDFSKYKVSAYFVKDDKVYKYAINGAPFNGLNNLKAYGMRAMCFDYAFLDVDGNPVRDLGGGFKMEDVGNFMPAFATDPMRTVAISGPFATMTKNSVQFNRYVSLSNNTATPSQHYQIAQLGTHPSAPGFSGMAIINAESANNSLHAIHSYRDNQGQQSGVKTSEILTSARTQVQMNPNQPLDRYVYDVLTSWFEVLTEAYISRTDGSVTRGKKEISIDEAIALLKQGRNIKADEIPEASNLGKKWAAENGGNIKKLIHHQFDKSHPRGDPHFHHPLHDIDPKQYGAHIFYKGSNELLLEKKAEEKQRQLEAVKKIKEDASKNNGGRNQR